jgi:hypothetical protein
LRQKLAKIVCLVLETNEEISINSNLKDFKFQDEAKKSEIFFEKLKCIVYNKK